MNNTQIVLTEAVYYILLALTEPLHGYGIMQKTASLSDGRLILSAGTLYGALSSLIDKRWISLIEGNDASRKKEYIITESGQIVLENELERLRELVRNGETILNNQKYN